MPGGRPSRTPAYRIKLPAMANCERCQWFREDRDSRVVQRLAADHYVETGHYIRMDQTTTTVWDSTYTPTG